MGTINTIRILRPDDITQVLELSYKAVVERGWADMEFNKIHFNQQVKQTIVYYRNKCFGMFKGDVLIGFCIAQLVPFVWTTNKKCYIELIHLDVNHRNAGYYQLLLNSVVSFCKRMNIKHIVTSNISFLLEPNDRINFFIKNGFQESEIKWELVLD